MHFQGERNRDIWQKNQKHRIHHRPCDHQKLRCRRCVCGLPVHAATSDQRRDNQGVLHTGILRNRRSKGLRTVAIAKDVESQGAMGVVLNAPISNLNLSAVAMAVDIPVIITVTKKDTDILSRIESGATILNVACAQETPEIVANIRKDFPDIPIIASGGKTEESIMKTIEACANAITYTPPSTQDLFKEMMLKYRET